MQFKRKFLAIIVIFTFMMMCAVSSFAVETVSTLTDLEAAIASGGQIELMADIQGSIVIPTATTIELDLNGYELSSSTGNTVVNNGTLTINGTGKISASGSGHSALINNTDGTVTIDGGAELYATASQAIKNYGSMTIEDATVSIASTATTPVVSNGWYDPNNYATADYGNEPAEDTAILTINGGSFTSAGDNTYTIKNDNYGVLAINGGSISSAAHTDGRQFNVIWNWNEITITGGTFTQNDTKMSMLGNGFDDAERAKGIFNIKGGTFNQPNQKYLFWDYTSNSATGEDTGTITIDDGTFNAFVGANHQKTLTINGGTYTKGVGFYNDEEITINGGTFNCPVGVSITAPMTINGGTFNDYIGFNTAPIEINGGTFGDIYGAKDVVTINSGDFAGYNGELYSGLTENGAVVVNGGNFAMAVPEEALGSGINYEVNANTGSYPYSYYATEAEAETAAGETGTVRDLHPITYSIEYIVDEVVVLSGDVDDITTLLPDELIPEQPSKAGYEFVGWFYEDDDSMLNEYYPDLDKLEDVIDYLDDGKLTVTAGFEKWELQLLSPSGEITSTGATFSNLKLNYSPADSNTGRVAGYYVGVRFIAPTYETCAWDESYALYSNNGGTSWKTFEDYMDGYTQDDRGYLDAWIFITEAELPSLIANHQSKTFTYVMDADGDSERDSQTFVLEINPQNIELIKDNERYAKYVNWQRINTVTYVIVEWDEDEQNYVVIENLGSEEVPEGGKLQNIPTLTIPEGMCGYDFSFDYWDDETELEDVEILGDTQIEFYFYDHIWEDWEVTTPATCTESGEKTRTCVYDASHEDTEVIAPLGHNFGEWVTTKEATPFEEGHRERICTRCDAKEEETIPKTENTLTKGDLDYTNDLSIIDVRLLLQVVINNADKTDWTEEEKYVMDMNIDGYINIIDVRLLLQAVINNS